MQRRPAMEEGKVISTTLRHHETRASHNCKSKERVSDHDEGRDEGGEIGSHRFEPHPSEVSSSFPLSFLLVSRFTSPDM